MKRVILCLLSLPAFISTVKAEFGIWASAVYLNINGTAQFYNTQQLAPGNTNAIGSVNFSGNLGVFGQNSGMLKIGGAEIKSFRDNGGNVCGGTIYYTVYTQGSRPGSPVFTPLNLDFFCDCNGGSFSGCGGGACGGNDQKWQKASYNNDLTTLAPGNYTIEIYYSIPGHPTSGLCDQLRYDNNGNNPTNYSAGFTITGVTALSFSGISASIHDNNIKVRWGVEDDTQLKKYEVQKSDNGIIFYTIATHTSYRFNGQSLYFIIDNNPLAGSNYYRIKMFHDNNSISLSRTIRVYFGKVNNSLFIYPNPSGTELAVRLVAVNKGNYQVSVFDALGSRITTMPLMHDGVDKIIHIKLPANLPKSVYRLLLIDKREFYKQSFIIK